jgi:exosome complex RNA-binding protein Rrp42 (RNase PH superfamily)
MSEISQAEMSFYKESLRNDCRYDGRNLCDFRPVVFTENALLFPNALHGVKVSVPDSKSSLMIGINADIVETKMSDDGTPIDDVYIEIELHTSGSKNTRAADTEQSSTMKEIKDLIQKFIIKNINTDKLKLFENKLHWKIVCDIYLVGKLFLNDVDYIFKGIRACFSNCLFPKVHVNFNSWNEEYTYEIVGNEVFFTKEAFPSVYVVGEIDGNVVLDLSKEELASVDSYYILALNHLGDIIDIEKLDGNPVSINKLGSIVSKLMQLSSHLLNM